MVPQMVRAMLLSLAIVWFLPALAQQQRVQFEDPEQGQLYNRLIQELRCLVCQNQNLADSNADLAEDLRRRTEEMIRQGSDYDEIVEYMVDRYGDFVLYRPPFKSSTLLLWLTPFVLLCLIVVMAILRSKRQANKSTAVYAAQKLMDKNRQ